MTFESLDLTVEFPRNILIQIVDVFWLSYKTEHDCI